MKGRKKSQRVYDKYRWLNESANVFSYFNRVSQAEDDQDPSAVIASSLKKAKLSDDENIKLKNTIAPWYECTDQEDDDLVENLVEMLQHLDESLTGNSKKLFSKKKASDSKDTGQIVESYRSDLSKQISVAEKQMKQAYENEARAVQLGGNKKEQDNASYWMLPAPLLDFVLALIALTESAVVCIKAHSRLKNFNVWFDQELVEHYRLTKSVTK